MDEEENKEDLDGVPAVSSHKLSTWELVAARSRSHRLPQRAHGQKDFRPDGSEAQGELLQRCLQEHWQLLGEERVERLGNLVQAEWLAEEDKVELRSKPGKFWQTMGHVVNGRHLLYPEEALYLLECGCIELRRQGLPLSIQEGYELALATKGLSLHQYQVYAHLKRLGYVVTRFRAESVAARSERDPADPAPRADEQRPESRADEQRKRKHGDDGGDSDHERADSKRGRCSDGAVGDETRAPAADARAPPAGPSAAPAPAGERPPTPAEEEPPAPPCRGFGFSPALPPPTPPSSPPSPRPRGGEEEAERRRRGCRWDFALARFPNMARDERETFLPELPEHLVPPGAVGHRSDEGRWAARINLHRDRTGGWRYEAHNPHRRWEVSRDAEVRRCRDWADFKRLLLARGWGGRSPARPRGAPPREDPAVAPLTDPGTARTTAELLRAISIVTPVHILEDSARLEEEAAEAAATTTTATAEEAAEEGGKGRGAAFEISFDIFSADRTDFKKTRPGVPLARVCVCGFEDPVPDLRALKLLARRGGEQAVLVFGVADGGDISFFSFCDFKLPTDILG